MQVVVILKEREYFIKDKTEVHGVYIDLKTFYDESKENGYLYDSEYKFWYYIDEFGKVLFKEVVQNIKGEQHE